MIDLFNIENYIIDTSKYSHSLHGSVVTEFEEEMCKYVGAKYACGISSATNAIFLSLLGENTTVSIPSMIPPVVANTIILSNNKIKFIDNTTWVGNSYILHYFEDYKVIDSAQKVERDQFKNEANDEDLMIFSFYPTKPIGSFDGGMIVSNDKDKIDRFKALVFYGMSYSENNWDRKIKFPGWKMYLNSIQADIALRNLKKLDEKYEKLAYIRDKYNTEFELLNTSNHLYRISVSDNKEFIKNMYEIYMCCGIHYDALSVHSVYLTDDYCPNSIDERNHTVSIPFHEKLTNKEIDFIIDNVKRYK